MISRLVLIIKLINNWQFTQRVKGHTGNVAPLEEGYTRGYNLGL